MNSSLIMDVTSDVPMKSLERNAVSQNWEALAIHIIASKYIY